MQNKHTVLLVVFAVALFALLFMPYMSAFGESVTLMDVIDEGGMDMFFEDLTGLAIFAGVVAGVLGVVGGATKNISMCNFAGILGVAGLLIHLFRISDDAGAEMDVLELMGAGFWLALVAYVVAIIVANQKKI